ncbi:hepatic lectin-like isoform X1 [Thunnus maccoyii]|uniref:hepatic lectin-like isoform X1 n=1 Tax=Thunnus maccoyii TaxID=8240 RepID=UPI001C4CC637|nr:hepatic lectin-like isoform X1 [Thunnus maccoyii]
MIDWIHWSLLCSGPRSSERRFYRAVVLCLGLLSVFLLAGLIGLGVHYHYSVQHSAEELSTVKANLTKERDLLNTSIIEMTKERDLLNASIIETTKERDLLNASIIEITKERDLLNASIIETTKERDLLNASIIEITKERDLLNASIIEKTKERNRLKKICPAGWRMFRCSCYFLSSESGSWSRGRQDCREKGADLVVIDSTEEQTFLSTFTEVETWIGLTDRDEEGTWKWIDGIPLTLSYWETNEPNNGNGDPQLGEEDCAHIISGKSTEDNWNDRSCDASLQWICEKNAGV